MIPLLLKHVKDIDIHWLFEDTADQKLTDNLVPLHWYKHVYSENLIWTKRIGKALNEIEDDYILFLHEDWLPIAEVKNTILNDMVQFMEDQSCRYLLSYSHISRVTQQEGIFTGYDKYYYYKEENHVFQPAIWKKNVFIDFCRDLDKTKHQNEDSDCLNYMSQKNPMSVQNRETALTLRTTNSLFFPHMHALSEGLWNFTKYPTLKEFLETFGIDTNSRGIHSWWELDTQYNLLLL
jgi:hypothetical protein